MFFSYAVSQVDFGESSDVLELRNDLGLMFTKQILILKTPMFPTTIPSIQLYKPHELVFKEIEVLNIICHYSLLFHLVPVTAEHVYKDGQAGYEVIHLHT